MAKDDFSDLGFIPHDEHDDYSDLGFMPEDTSDNKEALMAGLEHFGDAATLGYLPQIQSLAEKPVAKAMDLITGNNISDDLPDYVGRRDENRKRIEQELANFPKLSIMGSVAGSLASGAGASALMPVKAATLAGRVIQAGKAGALIGATSNPGDIEGETSPMQLRERGLNAAVSGALSVPLHLGAEGLGKLGGFLSDKAKNLAEEKAFKALGPDLRKVRQNFNNIDDIGRSVLDEGTIGWIPRGYSTLAERAGESKHAAGKTIENIVNDLASKDGVPSLSRNEVANKLRTALLADESLTTGTGPQNEYFKGLINEFSGKGGDEIPLKLARQLKEASKNQIKFDRLPTSDIPQAEQFQRALYGEMKNGEEGIAENLAKQGKIPEGDQFLNAKKLYGNLARAEGVAQNQAERQSARNFLGLKDAISGATGAAIGGYLGEKTGGMEGAKIGASAGATIGSLGSKFAHNYGNQVSAKSMNAFSQFLAQSPRLAEMVSKNPALAPVLLNTLKKKEMAQPEPQSQGGEEPFIDKQLLGKFRSNPQLIDQLSNENLKQALKKQLDRKPADLENSPDNKIIPEQEAQDRFIKGN